MIDVRSAVRARVDTSLDVLLAPIRRGNREVQIVPEHGAGFGNQAYLWLWAYLSRRRGQNRWVLAPDSVAPWFTSFPRIRRELCLSRDEMRLLDDRLPWKFAIHDTFGADFSRTELHAFIDEMMTPYLRPRHPADDQLVINVRRGDYYSVPHLRGRYSFDFIEYLRVALGLIAQEGTPLTQIMVVSDDVAWCRIKLHAELTSRAEDVQYVAAAASPQDHFREVATARRIIGSNSSFSYWAGYVSNVLYGPDSQVVVPAFHGRLPRGHEAYQLDPAWTVVRDIPGGWDG